MSNDVQEQELGAEVVTSATASIDDGQESVRCKFENLCRDLNMDRKTEEKAFKMFNEVRPNYSLDEGEIMHWFCCCLYVACRQSTTPTVGGQDAVVMGNCVPLNNLLRSCQMSIYEFKKKIKLWCEMANLSQDFIQQIEELERKFSITFMIYKKYRVIFEQVFLCPPNEKKHSKYSMKCSYIKLDDMCWRLFLCAKNQKPTTTVDLVTSYNLMMCCIDLIFANVLAEKRTDLINPKFEGLPLNWNAADFDETQARNHCILKNFCEMTDEAKAMKATVFSKIMHSFFQTNTIFGKKDTLLGLVANENFERNLRSLNIRYEQYVLSVHEFDERILAAYPLDADQAMRAPVTPLTCKQNLPAQAVMSEQKFEPVANATNNVKRLSANISRITEPSDFVKEGGADLVANMLNIIEQKKKAFIAAYPMRSEAENRFRLARSLCFYLVDLILRTEIKNNPDISHMIVNKFIVALLTCCLELVLEAYKTELKFPWILDCFSITAFEFHKIIEIVVRHGMKDGWLTNSLVKHLSSIEETCLETLAWQSSSPAWDRIGSTPRPLPRYTQTFAQEVNKDRAEGVQIFLRKVYQMAWSRIRKFCEELNLCDTKCSKIWTIFERSITHETHLMQDRHLDQIIMCSIYIYFKVTNLEPKFSDIMRAYRTQPQAVNGVYRKVLIDTNKNGEPEYNDIIYFYNQVFVPAMKKFSIKYLDENEANVNLLLSPHPIERTAQPKKLIQDTEIFVEHMQRIEIPQSPDELVYIINRSPAKQLEDMNKVVRGPGKRALFGDDPGLSDVAPKRTMRDLPPQR